MRINSSFQRIEGSGIWGDIGNRILGDIGKSLLNGLSNVANTTGNIIIKTIDSIPLTAQQQHQKNRILDYQNKKKENEQFLKERNAMFGVKGRFF